MKKPKVYYSKKGLRCNVGQHIDMGELGIWKRVEDVPENCNPKQYVVILWEDGIDTSYKIVYHYAWRKIKFEE
jgi:hypothetical protein